MEISLFIYHSDFALVNDRTAKGHFHRRFGRDLSHFRPNYWLDFWSKFRVPKKAKMAVLELLDSPKLKLLKSQFLTFWNQFFCHSRSCWIVGFKAQTNSKHRGVVHILISDDGFWWRSILIVTEFARFIVTEGNEIVFKLIFTYFYSFNQTSVTNSQNDTLVTRL